MPILLHNYFRSSASYRVRIALNLKGLPHDYRSVHLNRNGGDQRSPAFLQLNPQGLVPLLVDDDVTSSQSLAIIEYLEERYPSPSLLPKGLAERAFVRSLAQHVACDVHPLNNLRVLKFLTGPMALTEDRKSEWVQHWIEQGLRALEDQVRASGLSGRFCFGDTPTMADCCLVPQIFSIQRFNVGLDAYPRLMQIHAHCEAEEAFRKAHPAVAIHSSPRVGPSRRPVHSRIETQHAPSAAPPRRRRFTRLRSRAQALLRGAPRAL